MTTILYVAGALVVGLFVLMVGMRVLMNVKASRMRGAAVPPLPGKAGKHVKAGKSGLLYFYSPACGACRTMTPIIKKLSESREGVFAVDISRDMATAQALGVMATPTMVTVRKGHVDQVVIGPRPPATIESLIPAPVA